MAESLSLHEYVTEAIDLYLRKNGGGIPNGFVYAINYIDADGTSNYEVAAMEDQSPMISAGLTAYLSAVSEAWVQDAMFGDFEDEDID